jgi:hypothetical protein
MEDTQRLNREIAITASKLAQLRVAGINGPTRAPLIRTLQEQEVHPDWYRELEEGESDIGNVREQMFGNSYYELAALAGMPVNWATDSVEMITSKEQMADLAETVKNHSASALSAFESKVDFSKSPLDVGDRTGVFNRGAISFLSQDHSRIRQEGHRGGHSVQVKDHLGSLAQGIAKSLHQG